MKRVKSQSVRTGAILKNCLSESKQKEKRKIERERKYTVRKRAMNEKKMIGFFFAQVVSLSVVTSI